MNLLDHQVVRDIPPTAYPIDILKVSAILEALLDIAMNGRSNSQWNAIYSLALAWICLTSSKLAFPTHLSLLHKIQRDSVQETNHLLEIPTMFGEISVPISPILATFLGILATRRRIADRYLIPPSSYKPEKSF